MRFWWILKFRVGEVEQYKVIDNDDDGCSTYRCEIAIEDGDEEISSCTVSDSEYVPSLQGQSSASQRVLPLDAMQSSSLEEYSDIFFCGKKRNKKLK